MRAKRSTNSGNAARAAAAVAAFGAGLAFAGPAMAAEPRVAAAPGVSVSNASTPPELIAYDGGAAAAQLSARVVAARPTAEAAARGVADAAADAPGRGLNAVKAVADAQSAAGVAFDPALERAVDEIMLVNGPLAAPTEFSEAIREAIKREDEGVRAAYHAAGYAPIWIEATGEVLKARRLLAALGLADAHAMPAARYGREKLVERVRDLLGSQEPEAAAPEIDVAAAAALERDLTRAYLKLAADLSGGFLDPRSVSRKLDVERPAADPTALLVLARQAEDPKALAESLPPQTEDYRRLLASYGALREIVAQGGWGPHVRAAQRSIRPMDRGAQVDRLRARLVALGDLSPSAPRSVDPETGQALHDAASEAALRRFQSRHGLSVDGVAGQNTIAALNTGAAERMAQLAVNLERARWMNRPMHGRRIIVNIPDYHVDVFEDAASIYRSRVVVGKRYHQTPEFSDEMTHIVVNPYWHVPKSIATEEFLPELREYPGSLQARNIHIYEGGARVDPWSVDWRRMDGEYFPFRMRQGPGRNNALGEVKFIFPNHHAVYLHDTPAKKLFSRPHRAYSHGCIRVATPRLLAKTLLAAQTEDPKAAYRRYLSTNYERHVSMDDPVPVHIVYRTAWVDNDGVLQLRPDVYGRDRRVAAAIKASGVDI